MTLELLLGGTVSDVLVWIAVALTFFLASWLIIALVEWTKSKPWQRKPELPEEVEPTSGADGTDLPPKRTEGNESHFGGLGTFFGRHLSLHHLRR